MKIMYMITACICLSACTRTVTEDIMREIPPQSPSATYFYYSYKAEEVIDAETLGYAAGTFTPDCTYIYGDTLFVANTQSGYHSLEFYSLSAHRKIGSLTEWKYKEEKQGFNGRIQAVAIDNGKLYIANEGSCIDIFDSRSMEFITRIGNRNWGSGASQLLHTHAMALTGDYIIVRMKNRLQVMLQSEVNAEKYQNIAYYARGIQNVGVNNSFASHQMVTDSATNLTYLTDYVQQKIQVIDTALIRKGDNIEMMNEQTTQLDFRPQGMALYKDMMYISGSDGSIRVYDRTKKEIMTVLKFTAGYAINNPQKLLVSGNHLWVTDIGTKKVVRIDISQHEIEEYD